MQSWRERAAQLKREVYAIYLAYRNPRVPWYARAWAACVVAYTFSPIDLIPDFVPILGYVDDLLLIPLGIAVAIRMIPPAVLAECRRQAQAELSQAKPVSWVAAAVMVAIWLLLVAAGIALAVRLAAGT